MKKESKYFVGLICLIMSATLSPIFISEDTIYYGYNLYYLIILVFCWLLFFILFRIIGYLFREKLRNNVSNEIIFKEVFNYGLGFVYILFIIGVGVYNYRMNKIEREYEI
jgi:threonine/homoserine/homoserine lactone efflux protein